MVAPAALRRLVWPLVWPLAATAAAGLLAALAFTGGRPEPGLAPFVPAGLMLRIAAAELREVEIAGPGGTLLGGALPGGTLRFRRDGDLWRGGDGAPLAEAEARRLDAALKLLRDSAPERTLSASELAGHALAEYGLDPPALTVTARPADGPPFTVRLGGANALGLSRYAQVAGSPDIVLLPGYVARSWEELARW